MTAMICKHCGETIRESVDPSVPYVHEHSHNGFCDVTSPANAVRLAAFNPTGMRTEAEPTRANAGEETEMKRWKVTTIAYVDAETEQGALEAESRGEGYYTLGEFVAEEVDEEDDRESREQLVTYEDILDSVRLALESGDWMVDVEEVVATVQDYIINHHDTESARGRVRDE